MSQKRTISLYNAVQQYSSLAVPYIVKSSIGSDVRLRQSAHAGAERDLRPAESPECQGESQMQVDVPFLEGDRAERVKERHVGFALRSVPLEFAVKSDEQPRPDEVRELVRSEAADHSEASVDQIAAEKTKRRLKSLPSWISTVVFLIQRFQTSRISACKLLRLTDGLSA